MQSPMEKWEEEFDWKFGDKLYFDDKELDKIFPEVKDFIRSKFQSHQQAVIERVEGLKKELTGSFTGDYDKEEIYNQALTDTLKILRDNN